MISCPRLANLQAQEAVEALARKAGLRTERLSLLSPSFQPSPARGRGKTWPVLRADDEALGRWIAAAAGYLGLEAEPMEIPYGEVKPLVRNAGPALLQLPGKGDPRFLALLSGGRRRVSVLGPDFAVHRPRPVEVCTALCRD